MPPKRLHKIKLEDVIAILSLSLFLAEVINILHRIKYYRIKHRLDITKTENENRYLINLTDDITF